MSNFLRLGSLCVWLGGIFSGIAVMFLKDSFQGFVIIGISLIIFNQNLDRLVEEKTNAR